MNQVRIQSFGIILSSLHEIFVSMVFLIDIVMRLSQLVQLVQVSTMLI